MQNFLLSLQAQGFSSIWRSGAVVESALLKRQLGLNDRDLISGIIYIEPLLKRFHLRVDVDSVEFVIDMAAIS